MGHLGERERVQGWDFGHWRTTIEKKLEEKMNEKPANNSSNDNTSLKHATVKRFLFKLQ